MNDTELSVIIPCYNRKRYLKDCLQSVLHSHMTGIEVICIDDGSTDDTETILKNFAKKDKRVKVLSISHGGAYEARWVGLKTATGRYVHFMDSDDIITPETYEVCYNLCEREKLDYLIFMPESFTAHKKTDKEAVVKDGFDKHYRLDECCCDFVMNGKELMRKLNENNSFFVGLPMRFLRRDLIKEEDLSMCDATYHADNFYSVLWLYRAVRAMAIKRRFYKRRIHKNSITMSNGDEGLHFASILAVIWSLYKFWGKPSMDSIEYKYLLRMLRALKKRQSKLSQTEQIRLIRKSKLGEDNVINEFVEMHLSPNLAPCVRH